MHLWESQKNKVNYTCQKCGKVQERRVMSPFLSFTTEDTDWIAEIRIPETDGNTYSAGKMDVCPACFRKISDCIKQLKVKEPAAKKAIKKKDEKIGEKKKSEKIAEMVADQVSFNFA